MPELYFILRWRHVRYWGWPRYKVRGMAAMEDDPEWSVVPGTKNLSFDEADRKRKELEASSQE